MPAGDDRGSGDATASGIGVSGDEPEAMYMVQANIVAAAYGR
jgi:hypothetical protein